MILAEGLDATNVERAIRQVRPAGVDSSSRTNRVDDPRRKDLAKVAAFLEATARAASSLGL